MCRIHIGVTSTLQLLFGTLSILQNQTDPLLVEHLTWEKILSKMDIFVNLRIFSQVRSSYNGILFLLNQVVFLVSPTDFFPAAVRCPWKIFHGQACDIRIFFASYPGCSSCLGNAQG